MTRETAAESVLERIKWPQEDNKIPQEILTDPDLFRLEMEKVFAGPTWHLVAHDAEIPNKGDYKTSFIGTVPILVSRDEDGIAHVLVNACAHRGAKVVCDARGNASGRSFQCIYHAWTYNLAGNLVGVSLPDSFPEDFKKENFGLPKARVQTYRGCIFATLSDATPPLEEYLGEMVDGLGRAMKDGRLILLGFQKIIFKNNWKIYAENLYDGYHTVSLHKAFRMLKVKSAGGEGYNPRYETYGHSWQEYRTFPPDETEMLKDPSVMAVKTKYEAINRIMNIFPCSIVSDQLDTLSVRYVLPRAVDQTEVQFVTFARQGESDELVRHRIRQGSNLFGPEGFITLEDGTALARMQMGAPARGENVVLKGTTRRFPPYRLLDEASIRHFYGGYRRIMGF
jgi:phenylpropionate dioxygenase-like ring-hydroxylating dioxygenase large terminal subunit